MTGMRSNAARLDMSDMNLRQVNQELQSGEGSYYRIVNPAGSHALACGMNRPAEIAIEGHAGYFCAGMNQHASISVFGNVGQGVGENMMSGRIWVQGDASQSAGATANGGLLVICGNASARCGISLKGADIVVKGNVGHMSMFMAQAGRLVVLGDAGNHLGDSIYEARIYVRGSVGELGADCIEKPMQGEHLAELAELLQQADCTGCDPRGFRRFGSARRLYNFNVENLDEY